MSNITQRIDVSISACEDLLEDVTQCLSRFDGSSPDQKNELETRINNKLADIERKISSMNNDLRSIPEGQKDYYEDEIRTIQTAYSKALSTLRQKRQSSLNDASARQTAQVKSNNTRSRDAVSKLDEAIRDGNEVNMMANDTLVMLHEDRNTINDINQKLIDIDNEAEEGTARAKKMLQRAFFNGFIAWIIVILLLALLGVNLYLHLRKK